MSFDEVCKMIVDFNVPYIKVNDINGKRVFQIDDCDTPQATCEKLKQYQAILATCGKITIIGATEGIKKQSWKDAYNWIVTFGVPSSTTAQTNMPLINPMMNGYVSMDHANLIGKLAGLEQSFELQKQILELKNQIVMGAQPQGFEKYLPMLGMFMDVSPEKMQNMMMFANMQSLMNGKAPAQLAGFEQKKGEPNKVELKGTPEEVALMQSITVEMDKLSDKTSLANIDFLLKTLNENPAQIEILMNLAKGMKIKTA